MPEEILMPKFGQTMIEGTIVSWEKKIGEHVKKGQVLLKIDSDKATMDVESEYSGILVKIVAAVGEVVPCGQIIAYIEASPG
jgi:pyruvate/2-oxoglutarate dehydrogenase complex dihydrolipoamide acyltransferase (E2) component